MQITDNWEIIKNKIKNTPWNSPTTHYIHLYRSCINILENKEYLPPQRSKDIPCPPREQHSTTFFWPNAMSEASWNISWQTSARLSRFLGAGGGGTFTLSLGRGGHLWGPYRSITGSLVSEIGTKCTCIDQWPSESHSTAPFSSTLWC